MANDFRKALIKKDLVPKRTLPDVKAFKPKSDSKQKEIQTAKRIGNTTSSVGILTSSILLDAPKDFFNKYDEVINETVIEVRNLMSKDQTSSDVAALQTDPENESLRTKATDNIKAKITQFNESTKGTRLLQRMNGEYDSKIINIMVLNELIGFGPFQPLWDDPRITEIMANGPDDIQIEIGGKLQKVEACHFRDQEHLLQLINRLFKAVDKQLSRSNPRLRGRLYDKSRIHAVHPVICPDGPNFNIRRHNDEYLGPLDVIEWGSINEEVMKDLGNYVHSGLPYLVVGGTSTGKTTLLDALTAFMPENKRGVILEQNLEMKPHPNKWFAAPMECIQAKSGTDTGVTMRDLVAASTQMRPESIYIGEVIDEAAYDLCQALNTGHDGASTLHANTAEEAMFRLMSLVSQSELVKGRAAYDLIASAFAIIVVANRFPDGSRRIVSVSEVANKATTDSSGNVYLPVTPLWEYEVDFEASEKQGVTVGDWVKRNDLSEETRRKYYLPENSELSWQELLEIAEVREEK